MNLPYPAMKRAAISSVRRIESRITLASASNSTALSAHDSAIMVRPVVLACTSNHYRVRQELRDLVLSASHSLLKDPPFSRLDLIACRNLLIYLDRDLQEMACNTFHYALNPNGFLMLGTSESADNPAGQFRWSVTRLQPERRFSG